MGDDRYFLASARAFAVAAADRDFIRGTDFNPKLLCAPWGHLAARLPDYIANGGGQITAGDVLRSVPDDDLPGLGIGERDWAVARLLEAASDSEFGALASPLVEFGRARAARDAREAELAEAVSSLDGGFRDVDRKAVDDGWPPPRPLTGPPPPPFPVGSLPSPIRDWVDAVAAAYQVPADLPAMVALGCVSAAVAGSVRARIAPDWVEEACLYVAVVLPSGERKSPIIRAAVAPLEAWERETVASSREKVAILEQERRVAEKRVARAVEEAARAREEADRIATQEDVRRLTEELERMGRPVAPRLLADDATPETLVSLMADHGGRLAVVSAEGGLFDILAGRYSNGVPNLDAVLKAFSCEPIRVDRKGRPAEHVPRPALALVFAVQPTILEELVAKRVMRGRGLLARFLFAVPRTALGERDLSPPRVPPEVTVAYEGCVRGLADAAAISAQSAQSAPAKDLAYCADIAAVPELRLDEEAGEILARFRAALEPRRHPERGDLQGAADWSGKLDGAVVRLALLLHLVEYGWEAGLARSIGAGAMSAAVGIGEYLIPHALAALRLTGPHARDTNPAAALLGWLRRRGKETFRASDALDGLPRSRFPDMGAVNNAIAVLEEFGWVRGLPDETRQAGPGRPPSPRFEAHPALFAEAG